MTGMEQGLRYIEREIRFMAKDQFGNLNYAKYADRVIEDSCGIPNFCTTVLSSKKPLATLLKVVRGQRGSIIMKFFNASLHDTRIEMVMVLAEANKLRSHHDRSSKNAYEYLMKLYRKANKRMIRLITGSKNKETYKSMYRSLRDFARMDDFDFDDNDEEDDEYFDDIGEFGDSEFAEMCLDAYREGRTPPDIDVVRNNTNNELKLSGNEEILREIATIENKLGRHLSDDELDKLLCGEDDDNDFPLVENFKQSSEDMIDSIVDAIYSRLASKLGIEEQSEKNNSYESLDDFIERESERVETEKSPDSVIEVADDWNDIPSEASVEVLVDMHNRVKNNVPKDHDTPSQKNSDKEETSDDETDSLPPNEELGGEYLENRNGGLIAANNECDNTMQNSLILNDVIRDYELTDSEIIKTMQNSFKNYFPSIGLELIDAFISIVPSNDISRLLTLIVEIRVNGDSKNINMSHLIAVVEMYCKNIAGRFDIDESMIDIEFNIVYSDKTFDSELEVLNMNSNNVNSLYMALTAITIYTYRRINANIDIRFINDPLLNNLSIFFFSKFSHITESDDMYLGNSDITNFINNELIDGGILAEIMYRCGMNCKINYFIESSKCDNEVFYNSLMKVISKYDNLKLPFIKYIDNYITEFAKSCHNYRDIDYVKVDCESNIFLGEVNLILEMMYTISTSYQIDSDEKKMLYNQLEENGNSSTQLENLLRVISMNIQVDSYTQYELSNKATM